jgi:hypothetical protein
MRAWLWIGAVVSSSAFAHPAGLNGQGCQNNRDSGDYQCHRGGQARQAAPAGSTLAPALAHASGNCFQMPNGQICFVGCRGGTYTVTSSGRKNYAGC